MIKQYRITAADFQIQGDACAPDAVLSPEDLASLGLLTQPHQLDLFSQQYEEAAPIKPLTTLCEQKYNVGS